ncbi:hypothetical protein [Pseudomonas sp. NY15354]|uniref:hypothetical protein n=1 Tax=Pseudomonas sp. NY15354 TaxID=3400351 RepID=UPI003A8B7AE1
MLTPLLWKHGWADAYAARNDLIAIEFLELVVRPSLAALTNKHQEYAASDDPVLYGFAAMDQLDLINKTATAFCLSIQALWERQLRTYLSNCVKCVPIADIDPHRLQSAQWGERMDALFLDVRGIDLQSFSSYEMLTVLHLMANVCRHGEGRSSRELFVKWPHLWPDQASGSVHGLFVSEHLLAGFVDAVVLFWMDMERLGLESFKGDKPTDRIAFLKCHGQGRLDSINRLLLA